MITYSFNLISAVHIYDFIHIFIITCIMSDVFSEPFHAGAEIIYIAAKTILVRVLSFLAFSAKIIKFPYVLSEMFSVACLPIYTQHCNAGAATSTVGCVK